MYPESDTQCINTQVLKEIDYFKKMYTLKPKVYLSYDRYAYFEKNDGDFRVTFDTNITTRRGNVRLESGSYGNKLIPDRLYLMEAVQYRCGLQDVFRICIYILFHSLNMEQNIKDMCLKVMIKIQRN